MLRKVPGTGCVPVTICPFTIKKWCLYLLEVPLSWNWDQETKNSNWLLFTSNFFLLSAKDNEEEVGIEEQCATSFSQDTEKTSQAPHSVCRRAAKCKKSLWRHSRSDQWESCWTTVTHGIGLWDFNGYLFSVTISYWQNFVLSLDCRFCTINLAESQ